MPRVGPIALVAALGVAGCGACGDSGGREQPSAASPPLGLTQEQAARVVARVGDETITLGDFATALDRMDPFDRLRYQTVEKRRELLDEMVDLELLAIEARNRGLDKSPETQEAVRLVLRDVVLDEARKALPTPTEIPMDEVRAYYESRRDEYKEPERRRVSAVVLADEKKAKEVLEEAKKIPPSDAAAWGKLVLEHSLTAEQEKKQRIPVDLAGDLGIVGPPDDKRGANPRVPDPVRRAVFGLAKVGDLHAEVLTHEGKFYVVRMSGMTPGHERSLAEAERQIRVELLKQKAKKLEDDLVAELRKKHKVEIDEGALAKIDASGIGPPPAPSGGP